MSPSHRATLATGLALIFCASGPTSLGQQKSSEAPIKIQSTLVNVPAIVSDRQGRYIAGLKIDDFKLYEDRVQQPIAFFDAAEQPLNIALLLDTSRSTFDVINDIRDAAKNFIKELRPQDRAMVVSFDYDVHELCPLTSDRKTLERAIKNARIGEYFGTTLRDAVAEIIQHSFKKLDGRKAIILLTDRKDFGSEVSEEELLDGASESDAMIYSVFYETSFPRRFRDPGRMPPPFPRGRRGGWGRRGVVMRDPYPPMQRRPQADQRRERVEEKNEDATRFLTRLSEVSAGRFYASKVTDLKKTFNLIAEELRHQYLLGFYPDSSKLDGSRHRLQVEVTAANAVVRARRSYMALRPDKP